MYDLSNVILHALLVPMGPDLDVHPTDPACLWGLPLCLWGDPATTKSARIRQVSQALGLPMEPVFASTRLPEDFSGVPVLKGDELTVECILMAVRNLMLLHASGVEGGVLFFDELSCARPAVQGALLSAFQDRRIGDTVLPPQIRILLAANPPAVAAGGWELPPPTANRMAHLHILPPSSDEWLGWLYRTSKPRLPSLQDGMKTVKKNWDSSWARATGIIGGFIRARGELLHKVPPEGHEDRGRAWPSTRTWEYAVRATATCLALDPATKPSDNALVHTLVQACVGEGAAAEWAEWLSKADLPEPEDVIRNGWEPDPMRLDKVVAVMASVAGYTLARPEDDKARCAIAVWKLLERVCGKGMPDIAMIAAEQLTRAKLSIDNPDAAVKTAARQAVLLLSKSGVTDYATPGAT